HEHAVTLGRVLDKLLSVRLGNRQYKTIDIAHLSTPFSRLLESIGVQNWFRLAGSCTHMRIADGKVSPPGLRTFHHSSLRVRPASLAAPRLRRGRAACGAAHELPGPPKQVCDRRHGRQR